MAALPYIQLYVSDYLADTAHLTTEEHGAYLLLIFNYWQTGKPLRADRLASIARLSNERWTDVEHVLNEFFEVQDGRWYHARIDADLEMVNETVEKKSKAGKASAASRKAKRKQQLKASNKCSTHEQQTEQNITEQNITKQIDIYKGKAKRFTPPKLKEAQNYFKERGCPTYSTEAQSFIDFYEAKGWMIGKNKMKDWKAAVRNWMKNYKQPVNQQSLDGWDVGLDGDYIEGEAL